MQNNANIYYNGVARDKDSLKVVVSNSESVGCTEDFFDPLEFLSVTRNTNGEDNGTGELRRRTCIFMDNLSHSRLPNRGGSTSVSKKICNGSNGGGPFVAQTIYDDVYGGPPKFGVSALSPRLEDYGEIFGSFHALRASSIPILDLPAVDESEVFFDARSSAFDYAEVFGGFDGLDFVISYEEMVGSSKVVDDGSSDEAWTPAGTESLSDCSDHSGNSHCMSNGDSNQSFGGSTEVCMSYNKVNREGNENVSNGKIHVTQLEMHPGFSCLVDEANPSPKGTDDDPSLQTNDDSYLNIDFDTGTVKGKHPRNNMPLPVDRNGAGPLFEDNLISQNGYGRSVCRSYEDFITVSEISLRTEPSLVPPPSRPPPKFAAKRGDCTKMALNCGEAGSEIVSDDHSLPLFDVEVDASSSAAASAAAMKEAMEKAQAQLQNAKDLWERKKEGVHGRMRLNAKNDMREKEGNLTNIPNRFKSLADERVQGSGEIHDHEMNFPAREERQKDVKATEVCSTPYGGEELLTVAEKTVPVRSGSRCLVSDNYVFCSEWKDATEFFELARADISGMEFESANNDEISNFVTGQAETIIEAWEINKDHDKKGKSFHMAHVLNDGKNLENMVHGKEQDKIKLKPNRNETRQKEQVQLKIHQGVGDLEENGRKFGVAQEFMEVKRQMFDASDLEKREKPIEAGELNTELELEQLVSPKDIGQEKKKVVKRKENGDILKEIHRKESIGNQMEEAIENEKREDLFTEASERERHEQKMRMILEQQESKKRLNLVLEDENFKGPMACKRQLEGVHEMEDHGKNGKEAVKVGVSGRSKLAHEREDDKRWPEDFQYREECEKGVEDSFRHLNIEGIPRDAGKCKVTQMLVKDSEDSADLKVTSMEHDELERLKDRHKVNSTIGSQAYVEMKDLGISAAAFQTKDDKNHLPTGLDCSTGLPEEFSVVDEGGERETTVTVNETLSKSGGIENMQFYKNSCASSACQAEVEHDKVPVEMEDADIQISFNEWTKKAVKETSFQPKPGYTQPELTNSEGAISSDNSASMDKGNNEIEENVFTMEDMKTSPPLDRSDEKAGQADVGMEEFVGRKKSVTRMDSDPEHPESNWFCCMEDKVKSSDQVEDKGQKVSVQGVNVRAETGSGLESTRPTISERTQKGGEFVLEVNANQTTERKEKILNQSHTYKGKESERGRSEAEFENDILRKLEEEREREREREKDRMPIDRIALEEEREREREREKDRMPTDKISLEPRNRVGAEARERAERAALDRMTAEARQKALAEARERLEKACAEARENSLAGKATMEARVKAERAAVERATAEARERAAEKAVSDRASFGMRERMERSVSDKFSASSRNNEMRQKSSLSGQPSLQSQSFGSSIASRYAYYSAYDERKEGVDGESPQRCKARLERYQRTAERAAKALAEKNMRDLLAQREQAERNRLAETLDADVRRWSSGKEGNLRALLSTLQYILGPDSGWQPIPLTEVITAAAVKKAYRKATLCVHPDKLQQRGASIHQKYICEKVFDLLKEAWNKFNSEER